MFARPGGRWRPQYVGIGHPAVASVVLFSAPVRLSQIFTNRNPQFHYNHLLHHNLQFHHNRPLPKYCSGSTVNARRLVDSIVRAKVSTTAAIVAASPGVISPRASAGVTACTAAEISATFSIGGKVKLTVRSRHRGRIRSVQSRIGVGSPSRASSTALRIRASDSPTSSAAAASVALLREPVRRPAGLPDRPFSNGRPRTRPGSFGNGTSDMVIPLVRPVAHSGHRGRRSWNAI